MASPWSTVIAAPETSARARPSRGSLTRVRHGDRHVRELLARLHELMTVRIGHDHEFPPYLTARGDRPGRCAGRSRGPARRLPRTCRSGPGGIPAGDPRRGCRPRRSRLPRVAHRAGDQPEPHQPGHGDDQCRGAEGERSRCLGAPAAGLPPGAAGRLAAGALLTMAGTGSTTPPPALRALSALHMPAAHSDSFPFPHSRRGPALFVLVRIGDPRELRIGDPRELRISDPRER